MRRCIDREGSRCERVCENGREREQRGGGSDVHGLRCFVVRKADGVVVRRRKVDRVCHCQRCKQQLFDGAARIEAQNRKAQIHTRMSWLL